MAVRAKKISALTRPESEKDSWVWGGGSQKSAAGRRLRLDSRRFGQGDDAAVYKRKNYVTKRNLLNSPESAFPSPSAPLMLVVSKKPIDTKHVPRSYSDFNIYRYASLLFAVSQQHFCTASWRQFRRSSYIPE